MNKKRHDSVSAALAGPHFDMHPTSRWVDLRQ